MSRSNWLLTVLLVALVARCGAAFAIGSGFHFADEAIYVDTARRLAETGGFGVDYDRVPAYPLFLHLVSLWLPADLMFLRTAQAAVAAFGSVFVFLLADRVLGRRSAIVAALVYALDPLLVIASGLLYPESVAALLLPPVVLMAFDASERDMIARSAIAGALLGILALFRPVALVLPPIVAGWVALTVTARAGRRMAHLGALGLAFVLVLAPWTARNFRIHGSLVPVATAGAHTEHVAKEEMASRGILLSMARVAWSDPQAFVSGFARRYVQFWELAPTRMVTDDPVEREELHRQEPRLEVQPLFSRRLRDLVSAASFALELSLAAVGLVAVARARTRWRQALLPVGIILAYAAGYALLVAKLRYRIPVLPLLFLFTAAGAAAVYSSLTRRAGSRGGASLPGSETSDTGR